MRGLATLRRLGAEPRLRRRVIVVLVAAGISPIPMVGTLGYFSSLIFGPILALLGIAAGVDTVHARRRALAPGGEDARWTLVRDARSELMWLWGLPVVLLTLGMLYNRNCDPTSGLLFWLLGPLLCGLFGVLTGVTAALVQRSRAKALALALLPMAACTALSLWRLYVDPALYAFDPYWGWFSGPLYDESVGIESRFVGYRGYNLAWAAALWLALHACVDERLRLRRPPAGAGRARRMAAIAVALFAAALGANADRFRWTASETGLAEHLSLAHETEHFVIHYAPESRTAREIEAVALEHEFAWSELETKLGTSPDRKVHSWIFTDPAKRRALMGAGQVEVSLPWKRQMYLSQRGFPHPVLHHELAHAFLADHGDALLGLSIDGLRVNVALIEGLPSALAPRARSELDLHDQAAALDRLEKRPGLAGIMGLGFWGRASSRAYTAAGSFVLWLGETRGFDKLGPLYGSGGDVEEVYGEALAELEREWVGFLREREIPAARLEAIAERYKKRSVFRRPCAHRSSALVHEAGKALKRRDAAALAPLETLCSIEPNRSRHRLSLATAQVVLGRLDEAAATLRQAADLPELTTSQLGAIEERRGDVAMASGDIAGARNYYEFALSMPTSEARARTLEVKLLGAREKGELADLLYEYFAPFAVDTKGRIRALDRLWIATRVAELPEHEALGHYLVGRQLVSLSRGPDALEALDRAGDDLPTLRLRRARVRATLEAALFAGEHERVQRALDSFATLGELSSGDRLWLDLWQRRADFFESREFAGLRRGARTRR